MSKDTNTRKPLRPLVDRYAIMIYNDFRNAYETDADSMRNKIAIQLCSFGEEIINEFAKRFIANG